MEYLSWYLFFVAITSFFGSFQAFLSTNMLREKQFSLKPNEGKKKKKRRKLYYKLKRGWK